MTYGVITQVAAPIEEYDAVHSALMRSATRDLQKAAAMGLIVHIGRPSETGFQVIEVWESKEHFDRFNRNVLPAVLAEISGGTPGPPPPGPTPEFEEFEVRGLLLPGAGVAQ